MTYEGAWAFATENFYEQVYYAETIIYTILTHTYIYIILKLY